MLYDARDYKETIIVMFFGVTFTDSNHNTVMRRLAVQ